MSAIPQQAPTTELGAPARTTSFSLPGRNGQQAIYTERERAADLRWPRSVRDTYPAMLNDAQIDGMYRAMMWAVRAFDYWLEPNGASPETVQRVSRNYNLPVGRGAQFNRRRGQRRFSFESHQEDALRGPALGHYAFEQVWDVRQDGPATVNNGWVAHLRKLAPRPPEIISDIGVAVDGGLEYVKVPAQRPGGDVVTLGRDIELPVDRLVFYAWDREGANWRGRSMLRSLYRPWKLKDAVMRDGAINIRRAGGIPYANAPEDANREDRDAILAVLRDFQVSEDGAAVFPHGTELKFAAASGGSEAVEYVKLQNEEMARAWLLTFMQLGQTQSGSRALAEPLIDYVQLGQLVIANWMLDVFNEHQLEDDVDLNEGPDAEFAPVVRCAPKGDPLEPIAEALEDAQAAGALPADSDVAATVARARAGVGGRSHRPRFHERVHAAERDLTAAESVVEWERIDTVTSAARDGLVEAWRAVRAEQIEALTGLIQDADGDLAALARLRVPTLGAALIRDAMTAVADFGVETATNEAAAQGVALKNPWEIVETGDGASAALGDFLGRAASKIKRLIEARSSAIAETLAGSLSETASRQAVEQTGEDTTVEQVVLEVVEHLEGLTDAFIVEQMTGAVQQGFNTGRREAIRTAPRAPRIEASALLDGNQCGPCSLRDGHVFPSLEAAEVEFPTGGNRACEGGLRCRCTLVAVWGESEPTVR